MKKIFKNIFLLSFVISFVLVKFSCFAEADQEIKKIHIESSGNNKYEAKFKAYRNGMRQAAKIIADNFGIKDFDSYLVPNKEFKKAFVVTEKDNESSSDNFYSADIDLKYDIRILNELFIKYGSIEQSEKFYEYMVIPIIKKKNTLMISQPGIEIFDYWDKNRGELDNYRLFYPKDLSWLKNFANYKDFSKVNFNEIYQSSPKKFYRGVLFVIMEQFNSSINSANPYILVNYVSISHDNKKDISTNEVELEASSYKESLKSSIYQIIHSTINAYGNLRINIAEDDLENEITNNENKKVYIFNFEPYHKNQIVKIKTILEKIGTVDIVKNTDILYNIKVTTDLNEEELAEELDENGFSYKIREDGYFLTKEEEKGA